MYDELIERLHKRIALTTAGSPLQDDLEEAADAIENMSEAYDKLSRHMDDLAALEAGAACVDGRGGRVMTYDELMESILTAQEQMLKHSIEANSVTLNGRKYGKLIENLPPNIKPTIFGMAVKAEYAMPDDYDFLVQYEPPHPKSNADRIRAMSDEELASFLSCIDTSWKPAYSRKDRDEWLDWLKEEATDG